MTTTAYADGRRAERTSVSLARDAALAVRQVGYEQRSFWRNRTRGFFSFVFPVMFLVLLGSLNSGATLDSRGGIPYNTFFVPGMLAYGVVLATFFSLLVGIATAREQGLLKRVQGTPLPAWVFVTGRVGSAVVTGFLVAAVMLIVGWVAYGVAIRGSTLPGLVLSMALGMACFSALGLGTLWIVRNADAAPVVANVLLLPLTFVSGVWFPVDGLPGWLDAIANAFPVRPLASSLQVAFDPATAAPGIVWRDMLVLAVWTLVGSVLAVRFLRRELRRS
jgi:ABC-2 type transport system permease protein